MSDAFLKDVTISWLGGELAAANTIIVALCGHLSQLDGGNRAYDSVFAAINRRRSNWIPILQKHNHLSIANVTLDLQKVLQEKQKTPQVLLQSGRHSNRNDDSFIHRDLNMTMDRQKALKMEQPKQRCQVEQPTRNWLDLPPELMANILHRIDCVYILLSVQNVCTAWRKICKDPAMWRIVYMGNSLEQDPFAGQYGKFLHHNMCKHIVDRSQGQLVEITIGEFVMDEILLHVANSCSQLKRLTIERCEDYMSGWTESLKKFPLLEELSLYAVEISEKVIETAGRYCPMLKTLKVNQEDYTFWEGSSDGELDAAYIDDDIAMAIGQNLHELRHLELIGNSMSNEGLEIILDGCRHLELLDLRKCLFVNLDGDLGKRCLQQIKCVKLPDDYLDYSYQNDGMTRDVDESEGGSYDEYEGGYFDESEAGYYDESDGGSYEESDDE